MQTTIRHDAAPIRMRNYGRILQDMIAYASELEDQSVREALTIYVAKCMCQKNLVWNKDQEGGVARVKEDIVKLSEGRLSCDFDGFDAALQQTAFQSPRPQQQGKKKKK